MTKKDLQKRIEELEKLVEYQGKLIDILHEFAPIGMTVPPPPIIDNESCPMGGMHQYTTHISSGWMCKCGKTIPHVSFPSTITVSNTN